MGRRHAAARATSRRRSRPASSAPTLLFEAGTVAVDTSCNTGSGPYTVVGETVTFGPIAMTRMACTDPATIAVEPQVLAVLRGTATVAIERRHPHAAQRDERARRPRRPGRADASARRPRRPDVDARVGHGRRAPTCRSGERVADAGVRRDERRRRHRLQHRRRRLHAPTPTTITFEPIAITLMLCADPAGDDGDDDPRRADRDRPLRDRRRRGADDHERRDDAALRGG